MFYRKLEIVQVMDSLRGKSEDEFGLIPEVEVFWLLDGTPFSDGVGKFANRDSSWLVKAFSKSMKSLGRGMSLMGEKEIIDLASKKIFEELFEHINTYLKDMSSADVPKSTLIFCRIIDGILHYYITGDSILAVKKNINENPVIIKGSRDCFFMPMDKYHDCGNFGSIEIGVGTEVMLFTGSVANIWNDSDLCKDINCLFGNADILSLLEKLQDYNNKKYGDIKSAIFDDATVVKIVI